MRSQLVVINKPHNVAASAAIVSRVGNNDNDNIHPWIFWETCIRKIAISAHSLSKIEELVQRKQAVAAEQIYTGVEAKKFLLEVICGLHSPVRGETEVHGQYKELLSKIPKEHELYNQLFSLHLEARKVRDLHLRGLGSQSYGSLARRKVRGAGEIHVLGAGVLVRDMLPWLMKLTAPLKIYVRNKARVSEDILRYVARSEKLKICELAEGLDVQVDNSAVIVAAPLQSDEVVDLVGRSRRPCNLVLDYRGESAHDPIRLRTVYLSLQDIFQEIERTKKKVEGEVEKAKALIQSLCH